MAILFQQRLLYAVRSRYIAVIFRRITHEKRPIAIFRNIGALFFSMNSYQMDYLLLMFTVKPYKHVAILEVKRWTSGGSIHSCSVWCNGWNKHIYGPVESQLHFINNYSRDVFMWTAEEFVLINWPWYSYYRRSYPYPSIIIPYWPSIGTWKWS